MITLLQDLAIVVGMALVFAGMAWVADHDVEGQRLADQRVGGRR